MTSRLYSDACRRGGRMGNASLHEARAERRRHRLFPALSVRLRDGLEPATTAAIQGGSLAVTLTNTHGVGYASLPGRTSAGYLPALNALMEAGYVVGANGAPPPFLGRRPEPVDLSWARPCFDTSQPTRCVRRGPPADGS